jgi:hypothetical protein
MAGMQPAVIGHANHLGREVRAERGFDAVSQRFFPAGHAVGVTQQPSELHDTVIGGQRGGGSGHGFECNRVGSVD